MKHEDARELIGRRVIYRGGELMEVGTITSVNDFFVFVRYGSDVHSKATDAADLERDS